MKGEIRAQRPTLASFQGGRTDARNERLLQRIQERNGVRQATLVLRRTREPVKPQLARQQVETISFEGTGKVASRAGPITVAIAAGLLAIIAPNLGTAQPTLAAATVQVEEADNPFGFVEGKTRVEEIGRLLGAKGIGEMEWVLDTHSESNRAHLLVADGVKALYAFDGQGKYFGLLVDFSTVEGLDLSKAKNWTIAVGYLGRTFVTAENFLGNHDGPFKQVVYMLDGDQEKRKIISKAINIAAIVEGEGGFRNPRLVRKGRLVLLHADKEDGTRWDNIHAFDGATGKWLGGRKADPAFLSSVGLAMLAP